MPNAFPSPLGPSLRPMLKRIGLDDRETEVYLALLPMKIGRATDIAKAAGQSRSHTYLVLRSLEQKGLVSETERGKVLHFVAEPPRRLLSFLQDREEDLKNTKQLVEGALPYLNELTAPLVGRPRVTMYSGLEGMKQLYREMLPNEFCAFFNPELVYKSFGKNLVHMLFGSQARLRGRDLLVNNEYSQRYLQEMPPREGYEIRLLPPSVNLQTETLICEDSIGLFTYDEEKTIVFIENHNLADSFRSIFEGMWAVSEEI